MNKKKKQISLSKSKYVAGVICLKRLYLQCYEPELAAEATDAQQAIFDQGNAVGIMAQGLFEGGVLVNCEKMPHSEAVARTRELMAKKEVPALFEAAFSYKNINVRVDILERLPRNRWRLLEVKSTAKVKDQYFPDVAIQKYVLENCGVNLSATCLMHLNREYVYDGRRYKLDRLFSRAELTDEIEGIAKEIPARLREQWKVLAGSKPPDIDPGDQCEAPYTCPFYDECNDEEPEDAIVQLPRISSTKREQLTALGIESIHDIPDDFPLTDAQRRVCGCVKKRKPYWGSGLKKDLDQLKYPLYFMDFETIGPAIPRHAGMRPFDTLPFQWSVHVQKRPAADVSHHEFLFEESGDPRKAFITSLLAVLEQGGTGSIVVFNQKFESQRLDDLARWLPQYSRRIRQVQKRLQDLQAVIRSHVYHPKFYGSFSLKTVLPALIPRMTYEGMTVAEGTDAGVAYEKLLSGELEKSEYQKLQKALLAYCRQDTLAMVKLLERLHRECRKK